MSKFKIDNEQIDSTVDTLKTLLTKCKELYEKEEQNDSEMQLLDDVYHQVEKGGWLE